MGLAIHIPGASYPGTLGNIKGTVERFITNGGITDEPTKAACRELYNGLKSAGIYAKADFIYPFVGASAASQSLNMKTPEFTDASYRIIFNNDTQTSHTKSGYLPGATDRWGDTKYPVPTDLTSFFIGAYNSTAETTANKHALLGGNGDGSDGVILALARSQDNFTYSAIGSAAFNQVKAATTYDRSKTGLLLANRISASDHRLYDNGIEIASDLLARDTVGTNDSLRSMFIGSFNGLTGATTFLSNATVSFVIGGRQSLTLSQVSTLNTLVSNFQSAVR